MTVEPKTGVALVNAIEGLNRAGRPLLRAGLALALIAYCGAIVLAAYISALTGRSIPDMTAGIAPMAIALVPQVIDQITRWRERHTEIVVGAPRSGPPVMAAG